MLNDDTGWSGAGWMEPESTASEPAEPKDDTKLSYHGKELRLEPINATMGVIAAELLKGHPALAILEPGDATRYEVILVPCWSSNIRLGLASQGIRPTETDDYLLCAKLNGNTGTFFATEHVQEYDIETIHNEWSCHFLAWWLRNLWREINARR